MAPGRFSPSDFALMRCTAEELDAVLHEVQADSGVPLDQVVDMYPCTGAQQGLLMQWARDHRAYNLQQWEVLEGLDLAKYRAAWAAVVNSSDILRSRFLLSRLPFVQVVAQHVEV